MFTFRIALALLLTSAVLTLAVGQERDDKKSKLPPLTFVANVDGVVAGVDDAGDKIILDVKEVVRQAVPAYGPQRLVGGGVQYVLKEQMTQKSYNLSPDVKIRLMNKRPEPAKTEKKKSDTKSAVKKDPKKDADATKDADGDNPDKDDKEKMSKEKAAKEDKEKDPDAKLGGAPGKKSSLAKGQLVRLALGRNNDRVNPQIYVMAVFVLSDGK